MKGLLVFLLLIISVKALAQRNFSRSNESYNQIFEAKYVQVPPAFVSGPDSCKRFYFAHFGGFDNLLAHVVAKGDTAKYLRVYFSFVVDKNGVVFDPHFVRVASTQYAGSVGARTIRYFFEDTGYYEKMVKQMLFAMPFWKPALQDGVTVACRVEDYLQFWVGLTPPKYFF